MKANDVFKSKYLSYQDLRGRDVSLTIDHVEMAQMPNGGDKKPAVYFRGKEKALLLNKTNFNTIVEATGKEDTDDWGGEKITIGPAETEFQGRIVDCIRVRRSKSTSRDWQEPSRPSVRETEPVDEDLGEDSVPF